MKSLIFSSFPIFILALFLHLIGLQRQAVAQTNTFLPIGTRTITAYTDVYKTNYEQPLQKLQAGVEVGYQLTDKIKLTGGVEFWNQEPSPLVAVGNRFYPFGATFIRYRALIGQRADVALGLGYNLKVGRHLLLEAASDYYFDEREIGFRLGLGYRWQKGSD